MNLRCNRARLQWLQRNPELWVETWISAESKKADDQIDNGSNANRPNPTRHPFQDTEGASLCCDISHASALCPRSMEPEWPAIVSLPDTKWTVTHARRIEDDDLALPGFDIQYRADQPAFLFGGATRLWYE